MLETMRLDVMRSHYTLRDSLSSLPFCFRLRPPRLLSYVRCKTREAHETRPGYGLIHDVQITFASARLPHDGDLRVGSGRTAKEDIACARPRRTA
jgi:hypothetical protein